jgi:hypothetical protein
MRALSSHPQRKSVANGWAIRDALLFAKQHGLALMTD